MLTHVIHGSDIHDDSRFYEIARIEDEYGNYKFPCFDDELIDAEVNELCVLEGDTVHMGYVGNTLNNHFAFWVIDKSGNIYSFKRLFHLKSWLADRFQEN